MTAANRICGKQTKKGTACRRELHWWTEGHKSNYADGYWRHMSEPYREACAARKKADEEAWLAYLYADPICWGWPTPDTVATIGVPEDKASALLVLWQDGRCAICGHARELVEDHDHATGLVRGWLCSGCNIQEGIYRAPDTLFGKYRERHPTKLLGFEIRYWDPIAKDYTRSAPSCAAEDPWTDAASEDIGL